MDLHIYVLIFLSLFPLLLEGQVASFLLSWIQYHHNVSTLTDTRSKTEDSVQYKIGDFWRSLKAVMDAESPEEKFEQKEILITYGEAGAYLGLAIFNFLSAIKIHKELKVKKARLQREKDEEGSEEGSEEDRAEKEVSEVGSLEGGGVSSEDGGRGAEGRAGREEVETASEKLPNSKNQRKRPQEPRSHLQGQLEQTRQVQKLQENRDRVHKLQRFLVQGANQGQGLNQQRISSAKGISFKKGLRYRPHYNINPIRD
ncbi:uncharacterized protein LOC136041572 isoform X1 [Artemia franciscana]|uniref:uncharacterized protein LOC136041572 isoform X1 n=1 Tax=Artemia franciscana TaxID=6661 RepID=UPI0032DAA77D